MPSHWSLGNAFQRVWINCSRICRPKYLVSSISLKLFFYFPYLGICLKNLNSKMASTLVHESGLSLKRARRCEAVFCVSPDARFIRFTIYKFKILMNKLFCFTLSNEDTSNFSVLSNNLYSACRKKSNSMIKFWCNKMSCLSSYLMKYTNRLAIDNYQASKKKTLSKNDFL